MKQSAVTIHPVQDNEQKDWDMLIKHPLQSWAWGEFRKKMEVDVVRLGFYKGEILIDGLQSTFHSIPHTHWTIGYLPKGSMPTQEMLETLATLGKEKRAIFIQLEPNVLSSSKLPTYKATKLQTSHHPLFTKYTFILDLTTSEEELLKQMHSKTRYNMKLAQKRGVIVKEEISKEAVEE